MLDIGIQWHAVVTSPISRLPWLYLHFHLGLLLLKFQFTGPAFCSTLLLLSQGLYLSDILPEEQDNLDYCI